MALDCLTGLISFSDSDSDSESNILIFCLLFAFGTIGALELELGCDLVTFLISISESLSDSL